MNKSILQTDFENAVKNYINVFCLDNECDCETVTEFEVYDCADMYLDFKDIKFSVDQGIKFSLLSDWYWFTSETKCKINLETYIRRLKDYEQIEDKRDYHIILLNEMIKD
jgi:hypothetical protein